MKTVRFLFNDDMARAIVEGRKTVTRRPIVDAAGCYPPDDAAFYEYHWSVPAACFSVPSFKPGVHWSARMPCAPGDMVEGITLRPIPGYDMDYSAGDDGHVYSTKRGEPVVMKTSTSNGYKRVCLSAGGEERIVTEHWAVCAAFYGAAPSPRHEVRHLNSDRADNRPDNLDWGTPEDNWSDRKATGAGIHESHHNAKLNFEIAEAMRASGSTAADLARRYGVDPKTAQNVLSGRTWVRHSAAPPSLPRWAARIRRRVLSVTIERVQDITEHDAVREGMEREPGSDTRYLSPMRGADSTHTVHNARQAFRLTWDGIYAAKGIGWDANPWVWSIEFSAENVEGEQ